MANLLGKSIGYLFVALVLLGPGVGAYFFGRKLYYAYFDSIPKTAIIKDCHVIKNRRGNVVNRSWAPQAETADKDIVKGSFGWKKKETCQKSIGQEVSVYVSKTSPKRSQINTFFQLWFRPLIFLVIAAIFYGACLVGYKKKKRK